MLNKKLNMRVLRHSLMIASTISVLTGCDYFTDNWEIRNGACQAISSEGNETALISDEGMVFMSMDKGCPDNLDFPGTRFITTRINDQTWKSLMVCNSATGFRRMVTLGDTPVQRRIWQPVPYRLSHTSWEQPLPLKGKLPLSVKVTSPKPVRHLFRNHSATRMPGRTKR
ncbi:hypothetical protein AB2G23_07920 [Escherichia coli]